MLLKSSIYNTKKFFQNTLQNFKSLFSGGSNYQRLPKTFPPPPPPPQQTNNKSSYMIKITSQSSYRDIEQWDTDKSISKKQQIIPHGNNIDHEDILQPRSSSPIKVHKRYVKFVNPRLKLKGRAIEKENRYCMVEEKLKEIEMMDINNVEQVLDVEEAIHYYSRLTSPAYLDIVDNFSMQVYAEFFDIYTTSLPQYSRLCLH